MSPRPVNRTNGSGSRRGPAFSLRLHPDVKAALIVFAITAGLFLVVGRSETRLATADYALLPFLAVLSLWPGIHWYRKGMSWLPLGELFCGLHWLFYVWPCLVSRQRSLEYSPADQTTALMVVCLFLTSFWAVYYAVLRKQHEWSPAVTIPLKRQVPAAAIWVMFSIWLTWCVCLWAHLLPDFGNALNIFRAAASASGLLSIIYLSYQVGRRSLSPGQAKLALGGMALGLIFNISHGYLNGPVQWFAAAALGFTLGRKRVPGLVLIAFIALVCLLQLGKKEYRRLYWAASGNYVAEQVDLVESYSNWLGAGWKNAWGDDSLGKEGQEAVGGLTERTNLLRVLAIAVHTVPDHKPYLDGQTYRYLLDLMIPRIFWPTKPRGTLPTETLGIYIGIQTEQGTNTVSIAVGQVSEAWVNFGWPGLVFASAFLGLLYGFPAQLTKSLNPTQVGWVFSAIFMTYAGNLENTTVELICSWTTTMVPAVLLLLFISKARAVVRHVSGTEVRARGVGREA